MLTSINNYWQQESLPATTTVVKVRDIETNGASLFFRTDAFSFLNKRTLRLLEEFKLLKDNWDEDGAIAPNPNAIRQASNLLWSFQNIGQNAFHVAPGPNGEIMIDLRKSGKSVEIIFYPNQSKYVKFPAQGTPVQGDYNDTILPHLLKWLNG